MNNAELIHEFAMATLDLKQIRLAIEQIIEIRTNVTSKDYVENVLPNRILQVKNILK